MQHYHVTHLARPMANSSSTSQPSHFRTWTHISMCINNTKDNFSTCCWGSSGVYLLKLLLTWKHTKFWTSTKRAQRYLSHKAVTVIYTSFNWMLTDKNSSKLHSYWLRFCVEALLWHALHFSYTASRQIKMDEGLTTAPLTVLLNGAVNFKMVLFVGYY